MGDFHIKCFRIYAESTLNLRILNFDPSKNLEYLKDIAWLKYPIFTLSGCVRKGWKIFRNADEEMVSEF